MAPDDVIEVIAPVANATDNVVDIPSPSDAVAVPPDEKPAVATPAESKPLTPPPEPRNPDLELLDALRKERDREREERRIEKQKLTEEATRHIQAERRRAAEAEKELQARTQQAIRAHWQAVNSDLNQITSAIGSTKQEIESAKRDLALAGEAGDHGKAADAQERIALAAADLRALEYGQTGAKQRVEEAQRAIESMAEREQQAQTRPAPQQRQQPRQPDQRQQAPTTPDQWIAQCPAATQDWLKANKDYVTDPKLNRKLLRFADEWVDDNGMESLNTAAFVKALNGRFGKQEAAEVAKAAAQETNGQIPEDGIIEIDPNSGRASIARRAVAAVAAPVSRSVASTSTQARSPTRVRLTPEQMAIAPRIYPEAKSEQEARALYAADLIKAQSEGKFASRE